MRHPFVLSLSQPSNNVSNYAIAINTPQFCYMRHPFVLSLSQPSNNVSLP